MPLNHERELREKYFRTIETFFAYGSTNSSPQHGQIWTPVKGQPPNHSTMITIMRTDVLHKSPIERRFTYFTGE